MFVFYPEGYIAPKGYYHREVVVAVVVVVVVGVVVVVVGVVAFMYQPKTIYWIVFKFDTLILGQEAVS